LNIYNPHPQHETQLQEVINGEYTNTLN